MSESNSGNLRALEAQVAFIAAETVLALKSLKLALMASRLDNKADYDRQLADLDTYTDGLWKRFENLSMSPTDD